MIKRSSSNREQRFFSNRQKFIIYALSKGVCQKCGEKLSGKFHADHIIPFSKGGLTTIINGQALCAKCNLRKSNNV